MDDPEGLLRDAPKRYRSVRIGLWHRIDWAGARRAASRYADNPAAATHLRTWRGEGVQEMIWRAWYERPCRSRIARYDPPDRLREISGSTEVESWQYFPGDRHGRLRRNAAHTPDPDRWMDVMTFTHEAVPAEVLRPESMWWICEGCREEPRFRETGRTTHRGRPAIEVTAAIVDWDTRLDWTEILWMADDYRLLVDATTGIILRAACLVDGAEFLTTEVFDLSVDLPIDRGLFEYRPPPRTAPTPGSAQP